VDHTHQLHAIGESNVEDDMGLGGEAANILVLNLRAHPAHRRLLRDIGDDVVQAAQIFIRSRLTGIAGGVSPYFDEILKGSRPAHDTRHGLGATLIARPCFRDDRFHIERFGGTTVQAFADGGAQSGEFTDRQPTPATNPRPEPAASIAPPTEFRRQMVMQMPVALIDDLKRRALEQSVSSGKRVTQQQLVEEALKKYLYS
jgi:hypothetical protein